MSASLANAKHNILLDLEHTKRPKSTTLAFFDRATELFAKGDYNGVIEDASQGILDHQHDFIQLLDLRLRAYATKHDYKRALEEAITMKKCVPWMYIGYHRVAQIHLIQNQYIEALKVYISATNNLTLKDDLKSIYKLLDDIQQILYQAAVDLAKSAKFKDAHEIANALIESLPTSPNGYLCLGETLILQCQSRKAIDVYDQGLSTVNDESNKQLLRDRRDNVNQQLQSMRHYDFITQAPLEVAFKIIKYFNANEAIRYMQLCDDWRKRFIRCPTPWRRLHISETERRDEIILDEETKHHIQHLDLDYIVYEETAKSCLKPVIDGKLKNLTKLCKSPPFECEQMS